MEVTKGSTGYTNERTRIHIEFWRYNPLENGHLEDQKRSQYNNSLVLRKTGCQNRKWTTAFLSRQMTGLHMNIPRSYVSLPDNGSAQSSLH